MGIYQYLGFTIVILYVYHLDIFLCKQSCVYNDTQRNVDTTVSETISDINLSGSEKHGQINTLAS